MIIMWHLNSLVQFSGTDMLRRKQSLQKGYLYDDIIMAKSWVLRNRALDIGVSNKRDYLCCKIYISALHPNPLLTIQKRFVESSKTITRWFQQGRHVVCCMLHSVLFNTTVIKCCIFASLLQRSCENVATRHHKRHNRLQNARKFS